jgi:hypothetical protein
MRRISLLRQRMAYSDSAHFWVEANCPGWKLTGVTPGPNTERARADFFVYERS